MLKPSKLFIPILFLSAVLWSCDDDNDADNIDLDAPQFEQVMSPSFDENNPNVARLRGESMYVIPAGENHVEIEATATDNQGVSEVQIDVHTGHDGHAHGRTAEALPLLNVDMTLSANGAKSFTFEEEIHLERDDYRAGPYHFSLKAVDMAGNGTSYEDGTHVHGGIYIKRPYMPKLVMEGETNESMDEVDLEPGEEMHLHGDILQHEGGRSFDVTFVRVTIIEDEHDDHDHEGDDDDHDDEGDHDHDHDHMYEAVWGSSMYFTDENGNTMAGDALPAFASDRLSLDDLFETAPFMVTEEVSHKTLRFEIEDEGGNLMIREFEIHAH